MVDEDFSRWVRALEARHLADLEFAEVSRALRALSSSYVERRRALLHGAALSGAGKRAAFALFYGPLHYLLIREIVAALPDARSVGHLLVDLGCGTGGAGAAWACQSDPKPTVVAIDRHPWTLKEAAQTYRAFGLRARTELADLATVRFPKARAAILAAFVVNELSERTRDALLPRLIDRASGGDRILVVEPIGGLVRPWWEKWRTAFEDAGGRSDQWRVQAELPAIVAKLDRAAGLDHHELTGRSLWLGKLSSFTADPRRA